MILANENEEIFSFFAIVFLLKLKKSHYNIGTAACNLYLSIPETYWQSSSSPPPLTPVFVVETMIYQPCYVTDLSEIPVTIQGGFFKKVDLYILENSQ